MKHFYYLLLLPTCALCLSLCKTTATPSASPTSKSSAEPIATASATSATTESASSAATASAISAEADAISSPEPEAAKVEKDTLLMCKTPKSMPSQILRRIAYVTSYNHETKCPNWVAWHLTKEHLDGPHKRNGVPYYDDEGRAMGIGAVNDTIFHGGYFLDLEAEEPRQLLSDWAGERYNMTHGHLCPAGDNKWNRAAMNQTFLLTNICPQAGKLNSGGWNSLENKCRSWAGRFGDIYIVSGPIYEGGRVRRTFGDSKVAVPDAFFKVVLCTNGRPKAIGFIYPNDDESHSMADMVCSVDHVEKVTGIDFFPSLPNKVEKEIESKDEWKNWQ